MRWVGWDRRPDWTCRSGDEETSHLAQVRQGGLAEGKHRDEVELHEVLPSGNATIMGGGVLSRSAITCHHARGHHKRQSRDVIRQAVFSAGSHPESDLSIR